MCIMHFSRCLICHQIVQYVCMCVYVVVFVSPSTCNRFFGVISWAVVVRIPRSIHICTHTFLCSPSVSTSAAVAAVYCYWCHLCTLSPSSSPPALQAHAHTHTNTLPVPLTLLPLSISSFTLFWLCVSDSVSSVRESKLKKWSIGLWLAWARACELEQLLLLLQCIELIGQSCSSCAAAASIPHRLHKSD